MQGLRTITATVIVIAASAAQACDKPRSASDMQAFRDAAVRGIQTDQRAELDAQLQRTLVELREVNRDHFLAQQSGGPLPTQVQAAP